MILQRGATPPLAAMSPTGAFDPNSVAHQNIGGHVGLEVTLEPPHAVVVVQDLVDANFVKQGSVGYLNEPVLPGDRILMVTSFHPCLHSHATLAATCPTSFAHKHPR